MAVKSFKKDAEQANPVYAALINTDAQEAEDVQDELRTQGRKGEKLPRYGQAYYITPEGSNIVSVPMVDDAERARLIKFWKDIDAAENAEEAAAKPTPQPKRKGLFARLFA